MPNDLRTPEMMALSARMDAEWELLHDPKKREEAEELLRRVEAWDRRMDVFWGLVTVISVAFVVLWLFGRN
jgi:hypothetical protein